MTPDDLRESRERLEVFLAPLLAALGRAERRRWADFYVRGLLLEGGRKTAAGMARRYGGDEQSLQQLVSQSPWDWQAIREQLARQVVAELGDRRCGWLVDDTGFPKQGRHSVGVARQYSGTLGKVGNCQVGVSLNFATSDGCVPLDFALYLPEEWTQDPARCERAGIPLPVQHQTKWELALEMIDRARAWGIPQGVVGADAGYGAVQAFRQALTARGLAYTVGIAATMGVWRSEVVPKPPPYQGRGRPRQRPLTLPTPQSVAQVARALPSDAWQAVTWREGSKGPMRSRFAAVRAQPAGGHVHGKVREGLQWLLIEWPRDAAEPTKYWLSTLPEDTPLRDLVWWAKLRWWIEQNYLQLKEELGLDHFEGRTWPGWHRHVTLTMIAFDFLVTETVRGKKNFWVDPPTTPAGDPADADSPARLLPFVPTTDAGGH